jgi:hypothetical protein
VTTAFLKAAKKQNLHVMENSLDADAAVIWSTLWAGRMQKNHAVYQHYRLQNKPVFIIEVGALRRNITWKISLNHVNALGIYGHTANLDPKRPQTLGLRLKTPDHIRGTVLIAAQHHRSLQLQGIDQEAWINQQIVSIRKYTDRPIVVRSHPRSPLDATKLLPDMTLQFPSKILGSYDDFDFNFDHHAIINYCSGPGIQAAIAGVPVITDVTSLAHSVSIEPTQIDQPPEVDRHQWLIEISHTEYLLEEVENGLWLKRLSDWL